MEELRGVNMTNEEIIAFLKVHLQSIQENDIQTYQETTAEDLTLYEWWITPHRIDGLPFHEFMMTSNAERGTVFGAEGQAKSPAIRPVQFAYSKLWRYCHCKLYAVDQHCLLMASKWLPTMKAA